MEVSVFSELKYIRFACFVTISLSFLSPSLTFFILFLLCYDPTVCPHLASSLTPLPPNTLSSLLHLSSSYFLDLSSHPHTSSDTHITFSIAILKAIRTEVGFGSETEAILDLHFVLLLYPPSSLLLTLTLLYSSFAPLLPPLT